MMTFQPINESCLDAFIWPKQDANKHSRGRLAVFSGPMLQTGAARLAAMAGARIGAGWVKLFADKAAAQIIACHQTSIMVGEYQAGARLSGEILGFDCAVIGMAFGAGASQIATIERLLQSKLPLVLDADALNILAKDRDYFFEIAKARNAPLILTPHAKEFARLTGAYPCENIEENCAKALELADAANAIIVLKGPKTIIAARGIAFVNENSSPWLASAGTGDVLAGFIGGLLAQGNAPIDAAKIAVFLHSQLGLQIGAGLIAEDLPNHIGELLNYYAPKNLKSNANMVRASFAQLEPN